MGVEPIFRSYGSRDTRQEFTLSTGEKVEALARKPLRGNGSGVLVQYLDVAGHSRPPGGYRYCAVREIRAPWSEGKAKVDAANASRRAAKDAREQERAAVEYRYQNVLAAMPAEAVAVMPTNLVRGWAASLGPVTTTVAVPMEALEAIVVALKSRGEDA